MNDLGQRKRVGLSGLSYRPADGRLGTVTDNTSTNPGAAQVFTYNYQAASYHLLESVSGPAHTVTHSYEPNRDVLTGKENKAGTTIRSNYAYTINSLGQRDDVTRSGTSFPSATPSLIAWDYNTRGELQKEDFGGNDSADPRDRVFDFDAIGNRKESVLGSLTLTGTANYSSNALNQYSSVNTNGSAISPLHN